MRIVFVAAVLLLKSAPLCAQGSSKTETAIRTRISALETAWNKRDAAGIAAMYTTDGDVMMIDAPVMAGRTALQAAAERDMPTQPPTLRINITPISIRFLVPDVAIVNTVARFNEGAVKEDRGTWVLVRRNGKWLIAALRVLPAERK